MKKTKKLCLDISFKDGKLDTLTPENAILLRDFISSHLGEHGILEVSTEKSKSIQQLRFFYGVILPAFSECMGHGNYEYLKYILKKQFLVAHTEEGLEYLKSLADLSVEEMSIFIDQCINLLMEYGGHLTRTQHEEYERIKI